jgi:RND family efflux transporter MFP subunit
MARAKLAEINDLKSYTSIKAPYDGVVTAEYMEEGDLASPGIPVIGIENRSSYKFVFNIPESMISRAESGNMVRLRVPAMNDQELEARIVRVNASGEPGTRQFKAEAELNEAYEGIRSGMYAEALFTEDRNAKTLIPESALVQRGQLRGVFVVNSDDIALLRWINLGKKTGDSYVVLSGLQPGERVVNEITGSLYDGVKIQNN